MSSFPQRTVLALMLAALSALALGQMFSAAEDRRPRTARAEYYSGQEILSVSGVVIRSETAVPLPEGDWRPLLREGERAAAGQPVFALGDGPADAAVPSGNALPIRRQAQRTAARAWDRRPGSQTAAAFAAQVLTANRAGAPDRRPTVTAPVSGVFAWADGLEAVLTPEDPWQEWSLPRETAPQARLIQGESWYFRCTLPDPPAPGTTVTARLPGDSQRLTLTVTARRGTQVLLRCDRALEQTASLRELTLKFLLESESGVEIPVESLYTVEGETGVWRLEGQAARFLPVTVLRDLGDTVVAALDAPDGLSPGDEILLEEQKTP